jgi:hypothetical protein
MIRVFVDKYSVTHDSLIDLILVLIIHNRHDQNAKDQNTIHLQSSSEQIHIIVIGR